MTDYQKYLINVLRYVTDFFEKNNIRYFVAYGTMLGAVRHNGIIPWDDDADVFVLRDDYERLLGMQSSLQKDGYDIISMESEGSYITYAKIFDNKTSLREVKQYPKMIGVFVDIFPLDYADDSIKKIVENVEKFSYLSKKYSLAISEYTIKDVFSYLKGFHLKTAWSIIKSFMIRKKRDYYYKDLSTFYKNLQKNSGRYLVDYSSSVNVEDAKNVIYESSWFEDYKMVCFEDFKVRVPVGYDNYLKCRYGDYMKFPPITEQKPQHSHYFLDMSNRITIEEADLYKNSNH